MSLCLDISSESEILLTGNVRMELPSYMKMLSIDELQDVQRAPVKVKDCLGIAVGIEPKTGTMVLISATGSFYELNVEHHNLPTSECKLIDSGQSIAFPNVQGKVTKQFEIDVGWFMQHAKKLLIKINLFG